MELLVYHFHDETSLFPQMAPGMVTSVTKRNSIGSPHKRLPDTFQAENYRLYCKVFLSIFEVYATI